MNRSYVGIVSTFKDSIPKLPAKETCFLIIDVQNDFVRANGFLGRTGQGIKPIEAILPTLTHFLVFTKQPGGERQISSLERMRKS